jgi:hypothetical protein
MAQFKLPDLKIKVEVEGGLIPLPKDAVITVGISSGITTEQRLKIESEISAQFPPGTKILIYNRDMMDVSIIVPIEKESDPE